MPDFDQGRTVLWSQRSWELLRALRMVFGEAILREAGKIAQERDGEGRVIICRCDVDAAWQIMASEYDLLTLAHQRVRDRQQRGFWQSLWHFFRRLCPFMTSA